MRLLIAIDDTDNAESIGTGRLARMLGEQLQEERLATAASVTRHQLLAHPDIPYTSHNSCACIEAVTTNGGMEKIVDRAKSFLVEHFHEDANPGLCVAEKGAVAEELHAFGSRAQQHVLKLEDAKKHGSTHRDLYLVARRNRPGVHWSHRRSRTEKCRQRRAFYWSSRDSRNKRNSQRRGNPRPIVGMPR